MTVFRDGQETNTMSVLPQHSPPDDAESQNPSSDAHAAEYEAIHDRLFLVKILLVPAVLLTFLLTGASAELANGLRLHFRSPWLVTTVYTALMTFGYAALFFPLECYQSFVVERQYEILRQGFGGWFWDFAKSLLLSLLIMVVLIDVVYFLLRITPGNWWLWAAAFYILFNVVLSNVYPILIMPLFHSFDPIEEPELVDRVKTLTMDAGLKRVGLFRWNLGEKTAAGGAALTGIGATRRIILSDTLLDGYANDEILSVIAHEIGHYVHRDLWRLLLFGSLLATTGFYVTARILRDTVAQFGFDGIADIGAFPIFVLCMFLFSLLTMPLSNAYSRHREYHADTYAVRTMKTAEPFVAALEKLAKQNLARKEPPAWLEALLHSHPSISRRIHNARREATRTSTDEHGQGAEGKHFDAAGDGPTA